MIQFLSTFSSLRSSFSSFSFNLARRFWPRSSMFSHQFFSNFSNQLWLTETEPFFTFLITFASILWFVAFFFVKICLSIRERIIFHQHFTPAEPHFTPADTPVSRRLRTVEQVENPALLLRGLINLPIMTS